MPVTEAADAALEKPQALERVPLMLDFSDFCKKTCFLFSWERLSEGFFKTKVQIDLHVKDLIYDIFVSLIFSYIFSHPKSSYI